jgi:hypothetical protein
VTVASERFLEFESVVLVSEFLVQSTRSLVVDEHLEGDDIDLTSGQRRLGPFDERRTESAPPLLGSDVHVLHDAPADVPVVGPVFEDDGNKPDDFASVLGDEGPLVDNSLADRVTNGRLVVASEHP